MNKSRKKERRQAPQKKEIKSPQDTVVEAPKKESKWQAFLNRHSGIKQKDQ